MKATDVYPILTAHYEALRGLPLWPHYYQGRYRTDTVYYPPGTAVLNHPDARLRLERHDDGRIQLQVCGRGSIATDPPHLGGIDTVDWDHMTEAAWAVLAERLDQAVASAVKLFNDPDEGFAHIVKLLSPTPLTTYGVVHEMLRLSGPGLPRAQAGWFRRHVFGSPADEVAYALELDRQDTLKALRHRFVQHHKGRAPKRGYR